MKVSFERLHFAARSKALLEVVRCILRVSKSTRSAEAVDASLAHFYELLSPEAYSLR